MNKNHHNIILVSLFLSLVEITFANVKLASVFSDNMVLQADKTNIIWGTADVGELITIEINGKRVNTRTGFNGKWKVELPIMKYGGPYELMVYGDDTLVLRNIMIGEVWLCAGQSNMRMTVKGVANANEEIAHANYKNIRFLTIPMKGSTEPQNSVNAKWEVCSPQTIISKTAVGYFFGREINTELNVAIGLIDVSYGGATIFTFMDENTVANTVDTTFIYSKDREFEELCTKEVSKWKDNGRLGKRPSLKVQGISTLCYNAMVNPIVSFAHRGAVWYQGESNATEPEKYVIWFGAYISMMRSKFNNSNMPFYFVQLAGFENQHNTKVKPEAWAKFRLFQEQCLKYSNTGMATAMDIGTRNNIHPKNKQEVGRRLALCALNQTYGKTDVVFKGPELKSIKKRGKSLFLRFNHCEKGLKNKNKGITIEGFSVVLENGKEIDVKGIIKSSDTIEIKVDEVHRIRYAYANFPVCPLYNSEGLPALPFDREVK